jgi:hypothetical protein
LRARPIAHVVTPQRLMGFAALNPSYAPNPSYALPGEK